MDLPFWVGPPKKKDGALWMTETLPIAGDSYGKCCKRHVVPPENGLDQKSSCNPALKKTKAVADILPNMV